METADLCDYCGRRSDRPSPYGCMIEHPKPDLAQRIVEAVESNLNNRRGLSWWACDVEVQNEIRDSLADTIRDILACEQGQKGETSVDG